MKNLLILLIVLFAFNATGQISHRITVQEKALMPSYLNGRVQQTSAGTTPPSSPVRASAEWEEIDALMVAWISYPTILTEIVRAAQSETQVIILCTDSAALKNTLTTASVPLTNIHFLEDPFNSIWCRDYGQWNVYTNDVDSLALIDWIYNRPRYKDDTVPASIQRYTGLPMYSMTAGPNDLIHTGGNFMVDGFGSAFSSKLILDENPTKTEAEIDTIMKKFMGIQRYIKMTTLPFDQIHHIDMHIKLLDEETLLVGEYPASESDGPQIEANLQYVLANFNSVYGTPYKVIRIPMPPDAHGDFPDSGGEYRTYTNSVFVNNTVILPVYDEQYDTIAIRIYKEALPGYKIVPVDCNGIIALSGAIHCITKEVAAADPLLISHQQLGNTYNTTFAYEVNSLIQHRSGIQSAAIYFRTDTTQPYQQIALNQTAGNNWRGNIPSQAAGTSIYYYIEANSVSGKTQDRPMSAPTGYWKFDVLLNTGLANSLETFTNLGAAFPNPSSGITCIPVSTAGNENISIALKNILGEKVLGIYNGTNSGERKYFMNTSQLTPGVYFLEMSSVLIRFTQKIIVR